MKACFKGDISIELENGFVISPRIMALLTLIEQTGSLNAAAKQLGVSYSHSWHMLHRVNCQLQMPVVVTQRGGKGGGVARLTSLGKFLLLRYNTVQNAFNELLDGHYFSIDNTFENSDTAGDSSHPETVRTA